LPKFGHPLANFLPGIEPSNYFEPVVPSIVLGGIVNLQTARHVKEIRIAGGLLVALLTGLLARGAASGVPRPTADPVTGSASPAAAVLADDPTIGVIDWP
jgi:hypothetical protein